MLFVGESVFRFACIVQGPIVHVTGYMNLPYDLHVNEFALLQTSWVAVRHIKLSPWVIQGHRGMWGLRQEVGRWNCMDGCTSKWWSPLCLGTGRDNSRSSLPSYLQVLNRPCMHVAVTFYEVASVTLCRFNANCFRCLEFTIGTPYLAFCSHDILPGISAWLRTKQTCLHLG